MVDALIEGGIEQDGIAPVLELIQAHTVTSLVDPPMPTSDAIWRLAMSKARQRGPGAPDTAGRPNASIPVSAGLSGF